LGLGQGLAFLANSALFTKIAAAVKAPFPAYPDRASSRVYRYEKTIHDEKFSRL